MLRTLANITLSCKTRKLKIGNVFRAMLSQGKIGKSAQKGYVKAFEMFAFCHEYGYGTDKNLGSAIFWYKKAAKSNSEYAINRLKQLKIEI